MEQSSSETALARDLGVSTLFVLWPVQAIVATVLFLALIFRQRDLAVMSATVLTFGLGVRLWAGVSHRALVCAFTIDKVRAFPGESVTLEVQAENRKLLPLWLHLQIPVSPPLQSAGLSQVLAKQGGLLWFQVARFRWEMTARRRGVHSIGPPRLFTSDLFDFLSRRKDLGEGQELIVYPRIRELRPYALPRRDFFGTASRRGPVEDPVLILGTRDYQHGQPAKQIHWKASARHNRLQEKVLEATQHEKALLVVDVSSFARHDALEPFEETLEAAASLAARLDRRSVSVGLATNGKVAGGGESFVPVARSYRQLSAILEVLARLQMSVQQSMPEVLRRGGALTWGLSCVYFSYQQDKDSAVVREYFVCRRIPVTHFVCRASRAFADQSGVRWLGDLLGEPGSA